MSCFVCMRSEREPFLNSLFSSVDCIGVSLFLFYLLEWRSLGIYWSFSPTVDQVLVYPHFFLSLSLRFFFVKNHLLQSLYLWSTLPAACPSWFLYYFSVLVSSPSSIWFWFVYFLFFSFFFFQKSYFSSLSHSWILIQDQKTDCSLIWVFLLFTNFGNFYCYSSKFSIIFFFSFLGFTWISFCIHWEI